MEPIAADGTDNNEIIAKYDRAGYLCILISMQLSAYSESTGRAPARLTLHRRRSRYRYADIS